MTTTTTLRTLLTTLTLATATFAASTAHAQVFDVNAGPGVTVTLPAREPVSIAHLMTPEEIEATGLRELEPSQLAALSVWLDRYQQAVAQRVIESAEEDFSPSVATIETRIEGGFDGWVGDTIFRLANGQVWQQVSPSAKYYTAEAPRVTITRSPYQMHVDGVSIDIEVRRIR